VVLVGLVFVGLSRSGLLDAELDADWLGGTVIAGTLTWLCAQVVTTVRTRRPVYDLPAADTPSETSDTPADRPFRDGSGGLSGRKEATAR
jgi:ATP synthase protein I